MSNCSFKYNFWVLVLSCNEWLIFYSSMYNIFYTFFRQYTVVKLQASLNIVQGILCTVITDVKVMQHVISGLINSPVQWIHYQIHTVKIHFKEMRATKISNLVFNTPTVPYAPQITGKLKKPQLALPSPPSGLSYKIKYHAWVRQTFL